MKSTVCPNCGKENWWLKGEIGSTPTSMTERMECLECGSMWENTYTLTKKELTYDGKSI